MRISILALMLVALNTVSFSVIAEETVELDGQVFTLADGLTIEQIAGPPLIDRPIAASFDELGRLYVTESSGSNARVYDQLEEKPHRVLRLEDTDGDGIFDKRTIFADKMMFPEGCQWYDGSLYVGAPPEIWKLTDVDDDGVADKREVFFDGKTLNGCANDLHGPYIGPDGWLYWAKGAFEEQTYEFEDKRDLVTRAAHLFRRHPNGGVVEPVMTGGMDNPVDITFTPGGERLFTTTFLTHSGGVTRDGLIHAIYGGVYGKDHGVLNGHPRTGDLMPPLVHQGASAPCGLTRVESDILGMAYQNNILSCSFNLRKVFRYQLTQEGSSFKTQELPFLESNNIDFHPTDVQEDADGSIVVVDTGGWYKICCPTSQLYKPDVLGGIYRVTRKDAPRTADPRGMEIAWHKLNDEHLSQLLQDPRKAVRDRARMLFSKQEVKAILPLVTILEQSDDAAHRLQAVWALSHIHHPAARIATQVALSDNDSTVVQAALHVISVHKDKYAVQKVLPQLHSENVHNRRVAAEALGRIGDDKVIPALLAALGSANNRHLEHSLIYACIEIQGIDRIRQFTQHEVAAVRRGALIALDQIPSDEPLLAPGDISSLFTSSDSSLRDIAWWILSHHPDWAGSAAKHFDSQLSKDLDDQQLQELAVNLIDYANSPDIQPVIGSHLSGEDLSKDKLIVLLDVIAQSGNKSVPTSWKSGIIRSLQSDDLSVIGAAVGALNNINKESDDSQIASLLSTISADTDVPAMVRLQAMNSIPSGLRVIDAVNMTFICSQVSTTENVATRATAVDVIMSSPLKGPEFFQLANALQTTGPMELKRLMERFANQQSPELGQALVKSLTNSDAISVIPLDQWKVHLNKYGDDVFASAEPLFERVNAANSQKREKIESVLALMDQADARRGQQVFSSNKAACMSCHNMGYVGGKIGPSLNGIGRIRQPRDLLESIMYPSVSFVRSYEPVNVITTDGKVYNGVIKDDDGQRIQLQLDAQRLIDIPHDEIDEQSESKVSIMPAGLDKQFTPQQLADLVKFLQEAR